LAACNPLAFGLSGWLTQTALPWLTQIGFQGSGQADGGTVCRDVIARDEDGF
jgi:hypothetical protein